MDQPQNTYVNYSKNNNTVFPKVVLSVKRTKMAIEQLEA